MGEIGGLRGAVLVTRGGSVVLREAGGPADAGQGTVCTPETRFQIASVSKQFTAAAVMLLAEEGRVRPDQPIARLLPGCPPRWRGITLHHLLTHTSGLGHWEDIDESVMSGSPDPQDVLDALAEVPLCDKPGKAFRYSSPAYVLLGRIIAETTGQDHASFLRERLIEPLGMASTTTGEDPDCGLARGYRDGRRVDVGVYTPLTGAGDMWSTVDDMDRWTQALNSGRVLTAGSREAMYSPHVAPGLPDQGPLVQNGCGYGFFTGRIGGEEAVLHTGDNPGYRSLVAWLPRTATAAVLLTNDESVPLADVVRQVAAVATA